MSPNEFRVLRVFETVETAGKGEISKRLDISTDYAEYLCKSLFRKGFLETSPGGQYQLSRKGLTALSEDLSRIRDELKQKITMLDGLMEMTKLRMARLRKMQGMLPAEADRTHD